MSAEPTSTLSPANVSCYHCGETIPPRLALDVKILGQPRAMCCAGCQAVARAICDAGLADYYRFRTRDAPRAQDRVPAFLRTANAYDDERLQAGLSRDVDEDLRESSLVLEGIECAACLWLNERQLASLIGVERVEVNYATHRARVFWHPSKTRLSRILEAVHRIGYSAHPYDPGRQEQRLDLERRRHLRRLGLAGLLGMQVMMIAFALYSGSWHGIESGHRTFFRWVSLALTLPVVAYSANPFFAGALRDLRNRAPGMDVPVALGISVAFIGSVSATVQGEGEVYYDSVVMFVFLLLLARFLELQARRSAVAASESLAHAAPALATRLDGLDEREETVPVADLREGDRILIRPGETVPADGLVQAGRSTLDESLLTGESRPVEKEIGDTLTGGTLNYESPLTMEVERVGADAVLQRVLTLVDSARSQRPTGTAIADRVAGWFVSVLLCVAALVTLWWWNRDPQSWLPVTISVLVVTCPCALSLATPAAMTSGISALLRRGVVVTSGRALETLARADQFVFDKTGTLTLGRYRLEEVRSLDGTPIDELVHIAASVERGSEHPLAEAFRVAAGTLDLIPVADSTNTPGAGISARLDGLEHHLGTLAHARERMGWVADRELLAMLHDDPRSVVVLASASEPRGLFFLDDAPREGAEQTVAAIRRMGARVSLLSGDGSRAVARVAASLGIHDARGEQSPADKVARVGAMQAEGRVVAMTGDGINDAPVLGAADVSIALGDGTHAARANADLILMRDDLRSVADAASTARKVRMIIVQNLSWAIAYNSFAVPAAAAGWVPPWLAAVGMSCSSVIVVANSLRAGRA